MKKILRWICGVSFVLAGMGAISQTNGFISGLFYIVGGLICIPPTLIWIETVTKHQFSKTGKYLMVIGCFILASTFSGINTDSSSQSEKQIVKTENTKPEVTKPKIETKKQEEKTNWVYIENEDKMTSKKIYNAYIEAKEDLSFSFPYNGGSTPSIVIRNKDGVNDMMLKVTKGQFMTGVYGGNVRIRFDAEQPIKVNFTNTSDGSNDTIFIESTNTVISRMKKAKKIIIEAEFYNEGNRLMEFEVAGLKWEH